LPAEFTVKDIFCGAVFGSRGQAEVVDQKIRVCDGALLFEQGWADAFVDPSDKANAFFIAKEPHVLMVDIRGEWFAGRQRRIIGNGRPVPDAVLQAAHKISDSDLVAGDGGVGEQRS